MQKTAMRLLGVWGLLGLLSIPSQAAEWVETAVPPQLRSSQTPAVPARPAVGTQIDQAIATWTQRVQQAPQQDHAWVQLGDAFMQKARETADVSYYNRAEAAFQQALTLTPQHREALTGMAWVASVRHDFEQSITWAKQALALDASHHRAHGLLGDAAVEMGDYEAAFEHYQSMINLRPDFSSYSRAAHLLYLTGSHMQAIWMMQKALAAGAPYAEHTAWGQAQLALLLWHTGALLPAEQMLTAALKDMPTNPHLLAAMGKIKASQQDYAAALDYYTRASAITPQPETLMALGDLYRLSARQEEADKHYALVEAIQQLHQANGIRGDIQILRFYADHDRKLAEALQEAEALYQTRKNVYTADVLAWCYYKNGRYADAKKVMKKALSQQTPDAQILFHAGMIALQLGEESSARNYLSRALSLNPQFHPQYAAVAADALKQLGTHH